MDILKIGSSLDVGSIWTWFENKANRVEKKQKSVVVKCVVRSKIGTTYKIVSPLYSINQKTILKEY